jgi:hypothetical protein
MPIFVDGECGEVPPTSVIVKLLLSPRKAGDRPLINLMDNRATGDTREHFGVDGVRRGSKAVARQFRPCPAQISRLEALMRLQFQCGT